MSATNTANQKAKDFLAIASAFHLGRLPTEMQNPTTRNLSEQAKFDLFTAIESFRSVERKALDAVTSHLEDINELRREIYLTLDSGGRIFFCGCGATGRLSLTIESLWREQIGLEAASPPSPSKYTADQVRSFIAGGDYALVRSIENFEDHPEFGARQLHDLEFSANDLLIATTEGGETPFVIGATEEAARVSQRRPWFMFCNPRQILLDQVERSRRVLQNGKIRSLCLDTGPMVVAGSTRLQASTVLLLAAGSALLSLIEGAPVEEMIHEFVAVLEAAEFNALVPLIEAESEIYQANHRCLHVTNHYPMTVLTDTTERSPTFSLLPFENRFYAKPNFALTYLCIPKVDSARLAWRAILQREPRALSWPEYQENYGDRILDGFDFSLQARHLRQGELAHGNRYEYQVERVGSDVVMQLKHHQARFRRPRFLLNEHLLVKCAMNICSTLVMARLGRVRGNLMIYVKPSNNKLIDRSIRIIRQVLENEGRPVPSYEETCEALFQAIDETPSDSSPVLETIRILEGK